MMHLPIKVKFIIAVTGLLVIVLFLGFMNIYSNYRNIDLYRHLDKKIELSHRIALVLHELQKERGSTIGFLTDRKHFTQENLRNQREKTDRVIQEQKAFFDENSQKYFPELREETTRYIERISALRHRVDLSKSSLDEALKRYTDISSFFLETVADFATEAPLQSITKKMLAYSHFLFLLDYVGLERAGGIILLSEHGRSLVNLSRFSDLLALKKEHKRLFLHYADETIQNKFFPVFEDNSSRKILMHEHEILQWTHRVTSIPLTQFVLHQQTSRMTPKAWYHLLTPKINELDSIGRSVEQEIGAGVRDQVTHARKMFVAMLVLVGLSLLAFVMLIVVFLRLHKVERQQRTILDKHIIGSSTDRDGIITEVSQAFCNISGYTQKELIGQGLDFVCHPDTSQDMFDDLWRIISGGNSWQGKLKNQKKNGDTYWVYAHIEPLWDTMGKIRGYYAMRIDITEREKLALVVAEKEQENAHQKVLMEQQNRLALLGEMIGMIAHQWRQPLGAIAAVTASMQLKAQLGKCTTETVLDHAAKIEKLIKYMSETIDDFRYFFKPNQPKSMTDLEKIVKGALTLIDGSLSKKDIALELDVQDVRPLMSYEGKLKQVVINLIRNAEDALVDRQVASPSIQISVRKNTLCITDNAGGIPAEILPKIFDPYFSTKVKKDGTGLGLYMSKMIIEEHCKGRLNVKSWDTYTRFCIELLGEDRDARV